MFDNVGILAVDDDIINLEMLEAMLSVLECRLLKAENGQQALQILEAEANIDVVLLDIEMPVMDGFETIRQIKQGSRWRDIPVIVITVEANEVTRMLAMGANDFIAKPYNADEVRLRVMNHIRSKRLSDLAHEMNGILEKEVVKKTSALKKALDLSKDAEYEIAVRLGRAAEFRDQETGMHIRRISELSEQLARLAGIPEVQCEVLRFASPMHDVGKIGIPDRILCKPGKLDPIEFDIMKLHTVIGGKILSDAERYPVIEAARVVALNHHERWDGSGYPSGLRGEEIPLIARIVSIADVFDALTSERPYKKAFTYDEAIPIMEKEREVFFDPVLFDIFMHNIKIFIDIREKLKDEPVGQPPIPAMDQLA